MSAESRPRNVGQRSGRYRTIVSLAPLTVIRHSENGYVGGNGHDDRLPQRFRAGTDNQLFYVLDRPKKSEIFL